MYLLYNTHVSIESEAKSRLLRDCGLSDRRVAPRVLGLQVCGLSHFRHSVGYPLGLRPLRVNGDV